MPIHRRTKRWIPLLILWVALPLLAVPAPAQEQDQAAAEELPPPPLFMGYDPSPAYPHGRLHPGAPPETAQFAFMIGEFDCIDSLRNQDGTWRTFPAIWNANFFLNGHGIQDQYWNPVFATSNLRIYDSRNGKWMVTFFKKPNYGSGVWEGQKEGDNMVMRQESTRADGTKVLSRLTFHNISRDGFDWVGESVTDDSTLATWKSSCKRRQH